MISNQRSEYKRMLTMKITIVYGIVGIAWIIIFDILLSDFAYRPGRQVAFQLYRDITFLMSSYMILVATIYWYEKKHRHNLEDRRKTENLYGRVFYSASEGIMITDHKGQIEYVNEAFTRITGYSEGETLGRNPNLLKSGLQTQQFYVYMWASIHAEGSWQGEVWNRRKDGTLYLQWMTVTAVRDENGSITHYVGIFMDITKLREAEDQSRLHAKVFQNANEGIIITDTKGIILSVNPAFTVTTGYSSEEALGKTPRILHSGKQGTEFYVDMWASIHSTGSWQGEIWNKKKNGEFYLEWLSLNAVRDEKGHVTHYIGIFYDITERKQSEEHLKYIAHYDVLTSLPNRTLFHDRLHQALALAASQKLRIALLFIDLDRFKLINDTLGHFAGDRLLQQVAKRLKKCVRKSDTVSRYGGDEFIAILPFIEDAGDATDVAQKMIAAMAEPIKINDQEMFVTASIGISIYPNDCQDAETLIKYADWAMYRAKASRNSIYLYSSELFEPATRKMELERSLRRALEKDELSVHYQPQIDAETSELIGMEALLRWRHPELGAISPSEFIPIAEETGQITEIGEWVLRTVCKQNKAWQDSGYPHLKVSVNLSARQIQHERFVDSVKRILAETELQPQYLGLEITESISLHNIDFILQLLGAFKEMGIEVAIDDFGTGHSSLSYLKKYPVHVLKMDKTFVTGIETEHENEALAKAIIDLAHGLKLRVIAEGVETQDQLDVLRRLNCDFIQGYIFSPPLPADNVHHLFGAAPGLRLEQHV